MSNPPRMSDEELERQCRIIGTKVRSYDLGFDTEKPTDDERTVLIYAESLYDARARIAELEQQLAERNGWEAQTAEEFYHVFAAVQRIWGFEILHPQELLPKMREFKADRDRLAAELATSQRERDEARALDYRKVKLGGMSLFDQINRARSQRDELADDLIKAQADLAALRLAHDQVSAALLDACGEIARARDGAFEEAARAADDSAAFARSAAESRLMSLEGQACWWARDMEARKIADTLRARIAQPARDDGDGM